ncbi:hypothetical protein M3P05_00555 [Sansalvadorimonas sp. 2012CJ34-2]|uniref:Uncharacterized protein n=1 Tax=Parendozoicomonas callyspongiae TaxID=2942213 RepID=A0ABT0PAP6_9GAMM|nr:hypothetical protein [Sansalvadorimonas sp. 2012CJ34-2]MCL6268440.1 hypothetical protein [Sansalvadorimonas sp. 2012CJ34-2]
MKRNNIMNQPLKVIGMLVAISATMTVSEASYAAVSSTIKDAWYGSSHLSVRDKGARTLHGRDNTEGGGTSSQTVTTRSSNTNTHTSTSEHRPSYQRNPAEQSEVDKQLNEVEQQLTSSSEKLSDLKKQKAEAQTKLDAAPEDQSILAELNAINKEIEDEEDQMRRAKQKSDSLNERDTIFDDSLMDSVLNYATKYGYENEALVQFDFYKEKVRKAYANLYNRLPYRSAPLSREEDSGDLAVPRLTKEVFASTPVFAGVLDQQPNRTPVMGIRFKVETYNDEGHPVTCGAENDFDGYFHVAVSDSTKSNRWKTTLSLKDVLSQDNRELVDVCLKKIPSNETWWKMLPIVGEYGFNTVFSSDSVFVKGISRKEDLESNLTIQQMETILLLVRHGEVTVMRPEEDSYKLVLAGSEQARQALLDSLKAAKPEGPTVLKNGGKVVTAEDFK